MVNGAHLSEGTFSEVCHLSSLSSSKLLFHICMLKICSKYIVLNKYKVIHQIICREYFLSYNIILVGLSFE